MLTKDEQIKLAARLLGCSEDKVSGNCGIIPNLNALYFSDPVRGGDSIIIADDGSVLYANSSIEFDEHLREFEKGRRTSLESFNR